jgi:hypothetical protein
VAKTPKTIEIKVSAVDYDGILAAMDELTCSLLEIGEMFIKAAGVNALACKRIADLDTRES